MKTKNLHWKVFGHDFNKNEIISYDVFSHIGFVNDLKKIDRKAKSDKEFLDEVKRSLQYFFWAKAEHEVLVKGLFDNKNESLLKIDVFVQIKMNWDRFTEYLLSNRKKQEKKKK